MPLTTEAARRIAENVVTDVNANAGVLPGTERILSREAAILLNKAVIARPLMSPEVCSIHVKRSEYAYRWVNRSAREGLMYQMRLAQGFTNATQDDVSVLAGNVNAQDGEIRCGDLILMKIPAELYDAALKYNMQKAQVLSRMRGVYFDQAPSTDVFDDSQPKRVSVASEPFARGKALSFIPENPDAIVNDSLRSGRVNQAREVIETLRKEHAKE